MHTARDVPELHTLVCPLRRFLGIARKCSHLLALLQQMPRGGAANFSSETVGPTLLEALQDQLGLKLKSTTASLEVVVLDQIEEPSPN
ncbi:MAG TPA: DUF3738 domain-containing protein [Candidatus Acidoferrales bacterium]